MHESAVFHEDVFYEFFRPFRHPSSHFDIWGGYGLETFGEDLQIVKEYAGNFVWTILDGSDGPDQWITPGFRFVNRVCYLLTEIPHDAAAVDFRVAHSARSLTPVGLARRMSTLRRMIRANAALYARENA